MSLAAPWPLKIVIDSVLGHHPVPGWIARILGADAAGNKLAIAGASAAGVVLIAALGALASYVDNYYTESVGQYVARDLRSRVYHHLDRLSLAYYDTQQTGNLLSTITTDIATIQDFASEATLSILVDLLTIVGMVGLMFSLNFDFALIAVAVTPFLLFFVMRFKKAVKKATHEVR
jgi:subfamily B ATP-binding cassette protein MsbA